MAAQMTPVTLLVEPNNEPAIEYINPYDTCSPGIHGRPATIVLPDPFKDPNDPDNITYNNDGNPSTNSNLITPSATLDSYIRDYTHGTRALGLDPVAPIVPAMPDPRHVLTALCFATRSRFHFSIIPPSDLTGVTTIPIQIHPDKIVTPALFPPGRGLPPLDPLTGTIFPRKRPLPGGMDDGSEDEMPDSPPKDSVSLPDVTAKEDHSAARKTHSLPEGSTRHTEPDTRRDRVSSVQEEVQKPCFTSWEDADYQASSPDPERRYRWRLDTFQQFSCCSFKELFTDFDTSEEPSGSEVVLGDDSSVKVYGVGSVPVQFGKFKATLRNVYFTPDHPENIISMWQLRRDFPVGIMRNGSGIELRDSRSLEVLDVIGPLQSGRYFLHSRPPGEQTGDDVLERLKSAKERNFKMLNTWFLGRNTRIAQTFSRLHFSELHEIRPTPYRFISNMDNIVEVRGYGTVNVRFGNVDVRLSNVLYVPDAPINLLSIELLNAVRGISLLNEADQLRITRFGTFHELATGERVPNFPLYRDVYKLTSTVITYPEHIPTSAPNIENISLAFPQPLHPSEDWFVSNRYTVSATPYLHLFTVFNVTRTFKHPLSLGGEDWTVHGVGMVTLRARNGQELTLQRVFYVPDIQRNVLSEMQVRKEGEGSWHPGNWRGYLFKLRTGMFIERAEWVKEITRKNLRLKLWGVNEQKEQTSDAEAAET